MFGRSLPSLPVSTPAEPAVPDCLGEVFGPLVAVEELTTARLAHLGRFTHVSYPRGRWAGYRHLCIGLPRAGAGSECSCSRARV